jgi:hypothetical protein
MAHQVPSVTPSGITWAQLRTQGVSGHLESLIAAQAATANPSAAMTLAESGSAGTLTAATYYTVFTETNGIGESLPSPASAGIGITSTGEIVGTFPTLQTGNISRNTYVSTSATGPFYLAATGTTAATVTIGSLPANSYGQAQPPAVNGTGLSGANLSMLRSFKTNNFVNYVNRAWRNNIDVFARGQPVPFQSQMANFQQIAVVFAMLNQLCVEQGALLDANAGTLGTQGNSETGIGQVYPGRTWP